MNVCRCRSPPLLTRSRTLPLSPTPCRSSLANMAVGKVRAGAATPYCIWKQHHARMV